MIKNNMNAIGIKTSLPVDDTSCFVKFETETPKPSDHDLLVEVKAASVNPVDHKVRKGSAKDKTLDPPKILGWDASGIVKEVGEKVSLFKEGDEVFYAGDLNRSGSNAEYQLVDERIVGKKPSSISHEEAAALPLTGLTAWEAIFDRLAIEKGGGRGQSILILSGAGGVGSIAIQILKQLTELKVIATASRPESIEWCEKMGADLVVNHHDLHSDLDKANMKSFDYILNFVNAEDYWSDMTELIKPQGKICCIVSPQKDLATGALFRKSVTICWELMFTRSSFQTSDMIRQHEILNELSELVDDGKIQSTLTKTFKGMTSDNFRLAHAQVESGSTIGKVVVNYD